MMGLIARSYPSQILTPGQSNESMQRRPLEPTQDFNVTDLGAERAAWLAARCGKLTASRMEDAMSFLKNGDPSAKRNNYMRDLLAERLTGDSVRHYVTPAMQWGIDYEQEAKDHYSLKTNNPIESCGFIDHPEIEFCGATPDGFVGRHGLIETKCPTTGTFVEWVMGGKVPEDRKPQMLLQLAVTRRNWVDFVAYDPRIKDESKRLFIRRYSPTIEDIMRIEDAARKFLAELDVLFQQFTEAPL